MADQRHSRNRPHPTELTAAHQGLKSAATKCHRCGATFESLAETLQHITEAHVGHGFVEAGKA